MKFMQKMDELIVFMLILNLLHLAVCQLPDGNVTNSLDNSCLLKGCSCHGDEFRCKQFDFIKHHHSSPGIFPELQLPQEIKTVSPGLNKYTHCLDFSFDQGLKNFQLI